MENQEIIKNIVPEKAEQQEKSIEREQEKIGTPKEENDTINLIKIDEEIIKKENNIVKTINSINDIRNKLGLSPTNEIPPAAQKEQVLINKLKQESRDIVEKEKNLSIEEVFKMNPKLASIGSKEKYIEYVENIFPKSTIKDVLWHGSNYSFDEFEFKETENKNYGESKYKKGWFFAKDKQTAEFYKDNTFVLKVKKLFGIDKNKNPKTYAVVVDVQNPMIEDRKNQRGIGFDEVNNAIGKYDSYIAKNVIDPVKVTDVLVVFESPQIHILGSEKDINKFRDFTSVGQ